MGPIITNRFVFLAFNNVIMKKIIYVLALSVPAVIQAQPKTISQATITTKTTIVAPDDDEGVPQQSVSSSNGEEMRTVRFGGDGETKTTTTVKNDLVKTFSEGDMGRSTVIRDNSKKITTTIMEMMGRKSGYYATDEDQENMRKQMDSMLQSRGSNGNGPNRMMFSTGPVTTEVVEIEGTKKVAGYECKKALLIGKRSNGRADTTIVWYTPEFKIQGVSNTGGVGGGFGGFMSQSSASMDKINGFPLQYERNMGRGRKMTVQVTKIVTDKEVSDKEFELPKDIEIKAMKDMQNGMPGNGRVEFRVGG